MVVLLTQVSAAIRNDIREGEKSGGSIAYWNGDGVMGGPSIKIDLENQRAFFYKGHQIVGVSVVSRGTDKVKIRLVVNLTLHRRMLMAIQAPVRRLRPKIDSDGRKKQPGRQSQSTELEAGSSDSFHFKILLFHRESFTKAISCRAHRRFPEAVRAKHQRHEVLGLKGVGSASEEKRNCVWPWVVEQWLNETSSVCSPSRRGWLFCKS